MLYPESTTIGSKQRIACGEVGVLRHCLRHFCTSSARSEAIEFLSIPELYTVARSERMLHYLLDELDELVKWVVSRIGEMKVLR